jgi:hypothetical protein
MIRANQKLPMLLKIDEWFLNSIIPFIIACLTSPITLEQSTQFTKMQRIRTNVDDRATIYTFDHSRSNYCSAIRTFWSQDRRRMLINETTVKEYLEHGRTTGHNQVNYEDHYMEFQIGMGCTHRILNLCCIITYTLIKLTWL